MTRVHLDAISVEEGFRPWYAPDHDYAAQAVLDLPDGTAVVVGRSASFAPMGGHDDHNDAISWRQHLQRVKAEHTA